MPQDKLDKLKNLLEIVDESLTKEEFVKSFEVVVNVIVKLGEDLKVENKGNIKSLTSLFEDLKTNKTTGLDKVKEDLLKKVDKALDEQTNSLNFIRDKVRKIKDGGKGERGDKGDKGEGIKGDKGDVGKQGSPDTSEQIVSKVNTSKTKIKKEQIEGIDEVIDNMKAEVGSARGFAARASNATKFHPLTADGSTKIFAVPKSVAAILHCSDFPSVFYENSGFTINATRTQITITTDNAPSDGAQLIYQYSGMFN